MASVRSTTERAVSVAAAINARLFEHVLHSVSAILTCAKTSGGRLPYIQLGYVQLLLCPVWAEHSDGFSGVVEPDIVGVERPRMTAEVTVEHQSVNFFWLNRIRSTPVLCGGVVEVTDRRQGPKAVSAA
jgi:hypothetical protein